MSDFYVGSSADRELPPDYRDLPQHTQGVGISWRNIYSLWSEAQMTYGGLRSFKLDNTRIRVQHGGLMRPLYLVNTWAPQTIEVFFNPVLRTYISPQLIYPLGIFAVDNLHTSPHVERLYFRHDPKVKLEATREELWPRRHMDPRFDYVCDLAEEVGYYYLREKAVTVDDFDHGLVDPGFKT